jgi:adenosylmethionine---8-amino-7-oxononanoate aminotransferase
LSQISPHTSAIWHPFTQMKTAEMPIEIESASGCYLYAKDGRKILDAVSSWWVNIHGHAQPHIAQAIAKQAMQLEQVIFAGFTHQPAMQLAENLLTILPKNISKIFFSDDGSTAVEVALKMALQYWYNQNNFQKTKIVAFENAYHGDTFGAMSVAGKSAFNAAFQEKLFEVEFIPAPQRHQKEKSFAALISLLEKNDVAAFIFEPLIQGSSGMLMHDANDLNELILLAQQHNVVCIADEVMTGFGRTGKYFASDYLQNKADIICLSKGITGGFLPLGVTASSQKIFDVFFHDDKMKTFFHGHSYTANPITCAAANASFELLMNEKCLQQIDMISQSHLHFIEENKNTKGIKNLRSCGTILAFDLAVDESNSYFHSLRDKIYKYCLQQNILLRPLGNIIYTMPPYCVSEDELNKIYEVMLSCTSLID